MRLCGFPPAVLFVFLATASGTLWAKSHSPYRGAIVEDAATGQVLFENNADEVSPPASMTKLMTFAVLQDRLREGMLKLASPVPVNASDADQGGSQVWLKEGEVFPVEEMIYAMMIQSANDAAHALSRKAGGTTAEFVRLMNKKAAQLGMKHTVFRTPNGLPPAGRRIADGDLTTPRDFATLCRYLLMNTNVLKYSSVRERKFGTGRRKADRVVLMRNHNHLLWKVPGVDGFKTGYTRGAGYCLSTTAIRNGRRIIVVTMGSPDWKIRDREIEGLIEKGFARLPPLPVRPKPLSKSILKTISQPIAKAAVNPASVMTVQPAVPTQATAKTTR